MPQAIEITPSIGPGGTLEIPSQYGTSSHGPIGPVPAAIDPTPDRFYDFSTCGAAGDSDCCACVFHDANTKLMFIVYSGCFSGGDCCSQLTADTSSSNLRLENCQGFIDSLIGTPLDEFFVGFTQMVPRWLLDLMSPEQIAVGVLPDWWACLCVPEIITIPNFTPDQQASCVLPDIRLAGGACPSGYSIDPAAPACCKPVAPPPPPPAACCTSYSFYNGGCCIRGN